MKSGNNHHHNHDLFWHTAYDTKDIELTTVEFELHSTSKGVYKIPKVGMKKFGIDFAAIMCFVNLISMEQGAVMRMRDIYILGEGGG